MTISMYLAAKDIMRDIQTLKTVFDAGSPKLVEPLAGFLQPLNISFSERAGDIQIQVTPTEFALIGIFINAIKE